jgi:hypothetical protein
MIRKLLVFGSLLLCALGAHAQLVAISASSVVDAGGRPLSAAKLCFQPVDATETPAGFRNGSDQVAIVPVCSLIVDGVMEPNRSVVATITGIYYHIWLANVRTNAVIRDYGMTSITGSSWSLDTYDPSMAIIPVETLTVGTVTELSPGSSPTATITGSGPYLLNLGIPQGEPGFGGSRTAFISLAPSAGGNFQVAHGLPSTPIAVVIQNACSSGGICGEIWLQHTPFDGTYLYLVASDSGVTGTAIVLY